MKEERPKEYFIDPEIDQLIEQYHKKPNKEVRDRLNTVLIHQREKTLSREAEQRVKQDNRGKKR
ncbi:MAG: hypothetical protein ABQ298_02455 [Puniceicoccaceae bacterium]